MTVAAADARRFAYQQGPGRTLLNPPFEVDDAAPTTAILPPPAARGTRGVRLPAATWDILRDASYPLWPAATTAQLGRVLLAAFGLQRRELSNHFNDHRVIPSVRSKFPVHVFVLPDRGAPGYLDLYRHALVELDDADVPGALRPRPGSVTVLLAARYTDLPSGYARLRAALTELEIGVSIRSLCHAADLFGVAATVQEAGPATAAAARLVRGTGAGAWGPLALVTLDGVRLPAPGILPDAGAPPRDRDALLGDLAAHWSVAEAAGLTGIAPDPPAGLPAPAHGLPVMDGARAAGLSWAQVLWQRTAGRAPSGINGFTVTPCSVSERCVADLAAFAAVPAPAALRQVADRARVSVALQRAGGLPAGAYQLDGSALRLVRADPGLMAGIQAQFGYPLSTYGACGIRHATAVWVMSADVNSLIADFGPGAWGLLQRWCGWVSHGICTASAAHRLFARPARSFDELVLQSLMDLPPGELPVFITVCGRPQFCEPALDLRS